MIQSWVWYLTEVKKEGRILRLDLKNMLDDLFTFTPENITDKSYMLKWIIEWTRILKFKWYWAEILFNEIWHDFDWINGYFKSQKQYSIEDIWAILWALNSLLLFEQDLIDNEVVNKLFISVYESMVSNINVVDSIKKNEYNSFWVFYNFVWEIKYDLDLNDWEKNTNIVSDKYNPNKVIWLYIDNLNWFPFLTKDEEKVNKIK